MSEGVMKIAQCEKMVHGKSVMDSPFKNFNTMWHPNDYDCRMCEIEKLQSENEKLKEIAEEILLCEEHMPQCWASKYLVDDDFTCQCFSGYYSLEKTKERAKQCLEKINNIANKNTETNGVLKGQDLVNSIKVKE